MACNSVNANYQKLKSTALENTDNSVLGKQIAMQNLANPADQSGFHLLDDGIDALTARIFLVNRTEYSIDLQYYLIKTDTTSLALLDALLNAADRDVIVRFLLDDMFTSGFDAGMVALNAHPNFEIRIYNPFSRGLFGRAWSGIIDFRRINRRMHNKSFTADNQISIIGGRNIADEYFAAGEDIKFGDLDVVGIGSVVKNVSTMFDTYWNHETAIPVPAFAKEIKDTEYELIQLRNELEQSRQSIKNTQYAAIAEERALAFIDNASSEFIWAPYSLVYDSPDKGVVSKAEEAELIITPLLESLSAAENEVSFSHPILFQERGVLSISPSYGKKV